MIKQSVARRLPVLMEDTSGVPVTGLAFGDVSVKYKKEGDNSFTTKTLAASPVEWFEIGQGYYEILFTTAELNTIGFFVYLVNGGSARQYPGLADISANLLDDVNANVSTRASETNATSNRNAIQINDNNNTSDLTSTIGGGFIDADTDRIAKTAAIIANDDANTAAIEATLAAIKGVGWSTETLKAIFDGIAAFNTENYNGSGL